MRFAAGYSLIAGLVLATPAAAQGENDIVVTAPLLEEAARAFAREVAAPPAREDQLTRFESRVCPGIVGLSARQGQFVVDRISQRALELNLEVGTPGCRANILVIVTNNPDGVAQALADEQRYLMANYGMQENLNTRGAEALADFVETNRPIRWWHVSQTQTADGQVLGHTNPYGRLISVFEQEFRGTEVTRQSMANFGRLSRPTLQSVRNVVVIVDATGARNVRVDALADYIAMVSLSQTEPDANTDGYDTILNLFSDPPSGETGMTEWDLAYLQGLYSGRGNQVDASWQNRTIARRMRDELID
ncbi:MAG: hypothetical protein R3C31_15050 [Hyphomonadaceae bacterium]